MKKQISALRCMLVALTLFGIQQPAMAVMTELGVNYGYRTTYFSENNSEKAESASASVSMYFWETIALELSYTKQVVNREEKFGTVDSEVRRIFQTTQYYGGDLILILSDKKSLFQPYIKGGLSYFTKELELKTGSMSTQVMPKEDGSAPSYGVGLKIAISEAMNIKLSYDTWTTNITDVDKKDTFFKAGLTWML